MAEQDNRQLGDGHDNYGQAARKAGEAVKQLGQATAQKSAEATVNVAAHTIQASAEGGKAIAQLAAGTAAGGPVGAALAAVWSLRHTLWKIIICIAMLLVFLICVVVSLPSIVTNTMFRTDPDSVNADMPTDIYQIYDYLAVAVSDCVSGGYDYALDLTAAIIEEGGYDYDLSMEALINYGFASADYDICYVLAAYSASMEQRGTTPEDMAQKLKSVESLMFPVTYEVLESIIIRPTEVEGEEATEETIYYVVCTIHPFDAAVILTAFDVDVDAAYGSFPISNRQAMDTMAQALRLTLYGALEAGDVPPLTDAELAAFLAGLGCSPQRRELMAAALSLVGRVPYFWGGKSDAGWNTEWNTPKLVTAIGSGTSGTLRPYGLDCSGFTDWVYKTALGQNIQMGSSNQWDHSEAITREELLPGDLGFMDIPGNVPVNHVLLFAGTGADGSLLWVHCASGTGVVLNSPDYVKYYRRVSGIDLEGD